MPVKWNVCFSQMGKRQSGINMLYSSSTLKSMMVWFHPIFFSSIADNGYGIKRLESFEFDKWHNGGYFLLASLLLLLLSHIHMALFIGIKKKKNVLDSLFSPFSFLLVLLIPHFMYWIGIGRNVITIESR